MPIDNEKKRAYIEDLVKKLKLRFGDIVIFDRVCKDMSLWGGAICACAKFFGGTRYDHNAVVIEDEKGELFLLEATLSGVKLRPIVERILKSNSYEIIIRKLEVERTDELRKRAFEFSRTMLNRPYEDRMTKLFNAGFIVPTRAERERVHRVILDTDKQMESIKHELSKQKVSQLESQSMLNELKVLKAEREVLQSFLDNTERSLFENEKDESKVFCSDLVAALYQHLSLLSNYPPSNSYLPKHFAHGHNLSLQQGACLLPEISILKNPPQIDGVSMMTPSTAEEKANIMRCLRRQSLFSELSEADLQKLVQRFQRRSYQNGEAIFYQGMPGEYFFVIENGECDVYISDDGSPSMLVATHGPGNGFGDSALIFDTPRNATVRTRTLSPIEPAILWALDKKTFKEFISSYPRSQQSVTDKNFILKVISKHPFFRHLDNRSRSHAVNSFFPLSLPTGANVIRQGDFGDNFYILESGKCAIVRSKPGSLARMEHVLHPGQTFGEVALVYNSTRGASVKVTEDAKLWCMNRSTFLKITQSGSSALHRIFQKISSTNINGEFFMTKKDLELFLPSCSKDTISHAWNLINPIESEFISFSQFAHFHMLMSAESLDDILFQLAFLLLSPSSSLTGMITREDMDIGLEKWLKIKQKSKTQLEDIKNIRGCYDAYFGKKDEKSLNYETFLQLASREDLKDQQPLLQEYIDVLRKDLQTLITTWMSCELRVNSVSQFPAFSSNKILPQLFDSKTKIFNESAVIGATLLSGMVARTLVAPLERLKVLMQTQSISSPRYTGLLSGLQLIFKENGFRGFYYGNGTHLIKCIPALPLQLLLCDQYRRFIDETCANYQFNLPPELKNLLAGGSSGLTSLALLYPLDFIRSRLTIQAQNHLSLEYSGIVDCFRKVVQREGILSLYKGIFPSALGVFPYLGLHYSFYEFLRPTRLYNVTNKEYGQSNLSGQLICGAIAAFASQTLTYPLDVIRRRLQVQGQWQSKATRTTYKSTFDCFYQSIKKDGVKNLFRGLTPNLLKIVPVTAISCFIFEKLRYRNHADS